MSDEIIRHKEHKMIDGILSMFYDIVYRNWYPKALLDKKYKMYASTQFVIDALIAMSED